MEFDLGAYDYYPSPSLCHGPTDGRSIRCRVYMQNDDGVRIYTTASGYTPDDCVDNALDWANDIYSVAGTFAMDKYESAD